jgi:hypothetical protein
MQIRPSRRKIVSRSLDHENPESSLAKTSGMFKISKNPILETRVERLVPDLIPCLYSSGGRQPELNVYEN